MRHSPTGNLRIRVDVGGNSQFNPLGKNLGLKLTLSDLNANKQEVTEGTF